MPSRFRPVGAGRGPGEPDPPAQPPEPLRVLRSEELLNGAREIRILHGADAYRLSVTSNDKLILTK
jgi:hemin uptake protein HemP